MSEESAWAKVDALEDRLRRIAEAHAWQCDCTPNDPCRVRMAIEAGR